jgi:hypothetical protein
MSAREIQDMIQLRHLVDELRSALDTPEQTAEVIHNKIDILIEAGVQTSAIRSNVSHWQFVNNATSQSTTFEHNSQAALKYLTQLEQPPNPTQGA